MKSAATIAWEQWKHLQSVNIAHKSLDKKFIQSTTSSNPATNNGEISDRSLIANRETETMLIACLNR